MRRPRRMVIAAALLTLAVVAGCSGDDDDASDTTTAETTTTTAETTSETTAAPVDEAAEQAAAMLAVEEFFNAFGTGDFERAAQLLENGDTLQSTFQGLYDSFNVAASSLGAEAKSATLLSADEGEVVYDLFFGGTPALPDSSALVVKEDGQWKVSESTWNALLALAPEDA